MVRYPLRRLRRKKMAVAKPTMPKMAPYEEGSGIGAGLVMRKPRNSSPVLGVRFRRQAKVLVQMGGRGSPDWRACSFDDPVSAKDLSVVSSMSGYSALCL